MSDCILVGCDLHDRAMLLKIAGEGPKAHRVRWRSDRGSRERMIRDLRRRAVQVGAKRIVFAYEASGSGFVLWDELTAAGIECHVLAPTRLERSVKHRRNKTDERDAQQVLDALRAHVLAGVALPSVWVPDLQTRDDRELIRTRLGAAEKRARVKRQIRFLLKRNAIERSDAPADSWTRPYCRWLGTLCRRRLAWGASAALRSLLRQLAGLSVEIERLDRQMEALGDQPRYALPVEALQQYKGVGLLTAMTFLTELGDMDRFGNRRQVASFLGLTPSSHESGEADDRKGHITQQGPGRVRKVLCQAVWSRLRVMAQERAAYDRLVARNPKHKKIAIVARMRVMAVRLWHAGRAAQRLAPTAA